MANVTVRQTWNFAIAVGVKMAIMTYKMLTSVDVNRVVVMWEPQEVEKSATKKQASVTVTHT